MKIESDDILAEASCLMAGPREEAYGSIEDNWTRTGIIWGAILGLPPIPAETVGIMMAGLKISRIANDSTHTDNYIDAVAYLAGAGSLACN